MDAALFPSLDPDLVGMVRFLPEVDHALDDLEGARAMLATMVTPASEVDTSGLDIRDLPLDDFDSPASVRVYRPTGAEGRLPGLLHIHGGGFVLGSVDVEHQVCADLARVLGAVVVSVEYRLAPEHPYPAGLEDCYAGLRLLAARPDVDPERVAVHGQSAGGGLAAGVALLARDRGGPALCFQSLDVPVLDDRLETTSMRSAGPWLMWSPSQAATSWKLYLDGRPADQYAAPSRADGPGRPAAGVRRHLRARPAARRGQRVRRAADDRRGAGRAALLAGHVPRRAAGAGRRDREADERRAGGGPGEGAGHLRSWSSS